MKTIKKYFLALFLLSATACGDDFLEENPQDFLSTDNAFQNAADFQASVNGIYSYTRSVFYNYNDNDPMDYLYRTDLAWNVSIGVPNLDADFGPSSAIISRNWERLYKIVAEANTIISRIPASSLSDTDKVLFEAKARFFRGFAYRSLAYIFGGVPLVLEEIVTEKNDFVRATRQEVYDQIILDLVFASQNLPLITAVKDGEVSTLAAQHLLAEVYLAAGQFQNAVDAATVVIGDANTDLMTTRFGSRSSVTPGDVYWDLFQRKNQNRSSGNKEAIWVMQFETDVIGGGSVSTAFNQSWQLERVHPPLVRDFRVNGVSPFLWPAGDYTGGRGVGFMAPSSHFINTIWASDFNNDIRNANHNLVRKFVSNNPVSPYFGQEIDFHNLPAGSSNAGTAVTSNQVSRALYPYQSKATTPMDHPSALYDLTGTQYPYKLKNSAGGTYTDQYVFRLAETYLIRAEAYLGLGNTALAADDINTVRARSNASAITSGDVTIDYILDERMRELGFEEKRLLTLMRLGKLFDRINACNPIYTTIQAKHNLWPIPFSQIERNRGAVLEQNPGYPN